MAEGWADEVLADLRAARGFLDRIAARVEGVRTRGELGLAPRPFWSCGHQHPTRDEAIACLAEQAAAKDVAEIPHEGRVG